MRELTLDEMEEVAGGWSFEDTFKVIAQGIGGALGTMAGGVTGAIVGTALVTLVWDNAGEFFEAYESYRIHTHELHTRLLAS